MFVRPKNQLYIVYVLLLLCMLPTGLCKFPLINAKNSTHQIKSPKKKMQDFHNQDQDVMPLILLLVGPISNFVEIRFWTFWASKKYEWHEICLFKYTYSLVANSWSIILFRGVLKRQSCLKNQKPKMNKFLKNFLQNLS